jgi:hypothetical protein
MSSFDTVAPSGADDRQPLIDKFDPWEQKFRSHLRPAKIEPVRLPERLEVQPPTL